MSPRPRKGSSRQLPTHVYRNKGRYFYRDPKSGTEKRLASEDAPIRDVWHAYLDLTGEQFHVGTLDWLASHPFLRNAVIRLPSFLQPAPDQHSFVLGYDEKGKLVYDLQGSGESAYVPIASAMEHDGVLYLGSFSGNGVARIAAPEKGQKSQPGEVSSPESVE